MKTIVHVVGARPNYMKVAPLIDALKDAPGIRQILVNTGQHYDDAMSKAFLRELGLPKPDRDLEVGSASHAVQTAKVMIGFEQVCLQDRPDLVLVVGDVNSTMAASLVAAKLMIPIAHLEAGLRSFDPAMPEEINRIVTDRLADLLLTPSADGDENLLKEGVPASKIHLVGNIMIDTLMRHLPMATLDRIRDRVPVERGAYGVMTLHRPSNVDDPVVLGRILEAVAEISRQMPIVFPVHPRTRERLKSGALGDRLANVILTEPLGYIDFLSLTSNARIIMSDSGGLQEESTALGIPHLTMRENTERPVTITHGSNRMVGTQTAAILDGYREAMAQKPDPQRRPPLWDGKTAGRVATVLQKFLNG
ncbi:MAG TPA: UDP-N-acetylglucosamine 2-epimerase (non-hydrolyzing) [Vicinamibacterales bacterium]|nr:UDP-N-acetylglucosamine 2-epimerase (non-hydrolyzing) [Vicinamibacterales bacterium]